MARAIRDENFIPVMLGRDSADATVTLPIQIDAATGRLLVQASASVTTEFSEDAAHTSGDKGMMILAVRNDAGTALAGTDLDYIPLGTDSSGNLRVTFSGALDTELPAAAALADAASATPTTPTVGAVPLLMNATTIDRARAVVNGLNSTGIGVQAAGIVGQFDDVATGAVTENQFAPVRISTRRALLVEGVASGTAIPVSIAATVTVDSELPAAAALGDAASATPTTVTVGVLPLLMNATTVDRARAVVNGLDSVGTGIAASGLVGQLDDVATGVVTENQFAPVRISTRRAILIEGVASGTTVAVSGTVTATPSGTQDTNVIQLGGVAITVGNGISGTGVQRVTLASDSTGNIATIGTSVTPGTAAANLGKAEDAAHTTGDVGVMALAVSNEANTARAADGDYLPIATDTEGNVRMVGNRDHDAVDAGEVVGVGGRTIAHGTNPTAVAAADRTVWYFNRAGVPFVIGGHPNVVTLRTNYTAAQTDAALVTIATGLKIVVTRCSVLCDNANTVDVQARVGFGATTTPTGTGVVLSHPGIAAGSGVVEGNGSGMLGVGADGEDLRITSEVPTTGSIDVMLTYYTIES